MSAFLTLDSISLATPDGRPLFDNLTLSIGRERTGLVGRNGSGKSTLLDIMEGRTAPLRGSIHTAGRIGRLQQSFDESLTVAGVLGIASGLECLARIEAGKGTEHDLAEADWTLETRLARALRETGLSGIDMSRQLASFSGGERTRMALARLLLDAPDLLLLDEPTNNLDADGRAAVMGLLDSWPGGIVVASHDRALLEQVDRIVELSPTEITIFGGGWSGFAEAREAAHTRALNEAERTAADLNRTERKMQQLRERKAKSDKQGRAKRARRDEPKIVLDARAQRAEKTGARIGQVSSRLVDDKTAAHAEAEARLEIVTPLHIDLPACHLPASRTVLKLDDIGMTYDQRHLFGPLSLELRGPERFAIAGPNGCGKTTLLKLIAGQMLPASGKVDTRTSRFAMLDQHVGTLDPALSVLDNIRVLVPGLTGHDARAVLARFAFRGDAALQNAGTLSGGERLRAGLAAAFAAADPPELLLLDEPTNHLDLSSMELLEATLKSYDGAIIAISHDEAFLDAIGITRTLAL